MSDFFVNLGTNRTARTVIKKLGLPIPLPQQLKRATGPWEERPLHDQPVLVGHGSRSELAPVLAGTLAAAGASAYVAGGEEILRSYNELAEAWGRPPVALSGDLPSEELRPQCLVFDATAMEDPADLAEVHAFFHAWLRPLRACGRAIVLSRPPAQARTPQASAARRALDGFVRSMGREIGRKGATTQVLYVDEGADDRIEPILRFLLSERSAYVSGQPVHISATVNTDGAKVPYQRPLEGKVTLVTGSARGIGAAAARALAREGAKLIIMDRASEEDAAAKLVEEIGGTWLACDITNPEAGNIIAKLVEERFAGLDIIVHNAGVTRDKMLANMEPERWDQAISVNLTGLIAVNERLKALLRDGGRIVCLASIAGIAGNLGQANYAASKAGVIGYVQALAPVLAERGIAVNAVAPGFIETKMTAAIPFATRQVARRLCNLSQGGLPQDVAELITFLSSPGAAGMTGEVLRICGGSFVGA